MMNKRILTLLPFLILACAGIVLGLVWDHIPESWPSHWGFNGEPDHWTRKSVVGVFLPLFLGGIILFVLEIIAYAAENSDDPVESGTSPEAARILREANANVARLVSSAVALLFCFIALYIPLAMPQDPWLILICAAVFVGAAIGYGVWHMHRQIHDLRKRGHEVDLTGWKGIIYKNPADPRVWVPKHFGIGMTLNYAHPSAWWITALLIGIPIIVVLLASILAS
jgi:uncharacterized membrane protein